MSLLDADIHSAHPSVIIDADAMFSEDISYFGYPSFRRSSLSRLGSSRGNNKEWSRGASERGSRGFRFRLCCLGESFNGFGETHTPTPQQVLANRKHAANPGRLCNQSTKHNTRFTCCLGRCR